MDYTFYTYGTETPSSSYKDWVGVPGSPSASNQALSTGLEDAPATISSFDRDIDDALGYPYDSMGPLDPFPHFDPEVDWQSVFLNSTMPFPPPALTDDASSMADTYQPLSPVSDTTLVNASLPSWSADLKLPPAGDPLVDQPAASLPSSFDDFRFTFQYEPAATMPPCDFAAALLQQDYYNYGYNQGQYWPGQQPSQHSVGAAGAVAPGLATGMEVNADAVAFTAMGPILPPPVPVPSPQPRQDSPVFDSAKPIRTTRKKQPRVDLDSDAGSNYSSGESSSGDDTPTKKRRKQDTTKRYLCPCKDKDCGDKDCDAAFSRTHNLQVHIKTVHLGQRPYACEEPGCPRAFSRKHDLVRHHQSAHTTLGSPRNTNNAKGTTGKGAKGRKGVKKGAQDA